LFAIFNHGCYQPTKRSTVALKCHLYVESLIVNPFGVDEERLTDSVNFRVFVGKLDVEHQRFTFVCREDSVIVYKKEEDANGVWRKVDSLRLSIADLVKDKVDSAKPLFEFK
jgi:hypothetical protein